MESVKYAGVAHVGNPHGGFVFISVVQLMMAWWCYGEGLIRLRDLHLWFALHELVARRCRLSRGRRPRYSLDEAGRLLRRDRESVQKSVRSLVRVGLARFGPEAISLAASPGELTVQDTRSLSQLLDQIPNHRRRVPVPRRVVRFLASGPRRVLVATIAGHLLRCVYFRSGACRFDGSCKASWIACVFGVHARNVKAARRELIGLGWLVEEAVPQWYLNRYGARTVVNGQWRPPTPTANASAVNPPPLHRPNRPNSPPPESDKKLLYSKEEKHQEPAFRRTAGVFKNSGQGNLQSLPSIRNVKPADLKDVGRLLRLFEEAAKVGLIAHTDLDRQRFVGAAEHACAVGKSNPCGLFVWLVRNKRWHHITERDDHTAQVRMKTFVRNLETRSLQRPPTPTVLSPDARFARSLLSALRKKRVSQDPYPELSRMRPEWTPERWQRALTELRESPRLGAIGSARGLVKLGSLVPLQNIVCLASRSVV